MTTRRLLELWEDRRSLEFRARAKYDGQPHPQVDEPLMIIRAHPGPQPMDWCLDGGDVEELHQFTYDLLAGPTRDPRLQRADAQIYCGETVDSPANGHLECCLLAGHLRIGGFDHTTADGMAFNTPRF